MYCIVTIVGRASIISWNKMSISNFTDQWVINIVHNATEWVTELSIIDEWVTELSIIDEWVTELSIIDEWVIELSIIDEWVIELLIIDEWVIE